MQTSALIYSQAYAASSEMEVRQEKMLYLPVSEEAAGSQLHGQCSRCDLPCWYLTQVILFVIIFPYLETHLFSAVWSISTDPLLGEMWRCAV